MTEQVKLAAAAPPAPTAQIIKKQIPIDKLLMQFGKSQIQLVASEEELETARAIIASLQQTIVAKNAEVEQLTQERDTALAKVAEHAKEDRFRTGALANFRAADETAAKT